MSVNSACSPTDQLLEEHFFVQLVNLSVEEEVEDPTEFWMQTRNIRNIRQCVVIVIIKFLVHNSQT